MRIATDWKEPKHEHHPHRHPPPSHPRRPLHPDLLGAAVTIVAVLLMVAMLALVLAGAVPHD